MSRMHRVLFALTAFVIFGFAPPSVKADTIVIGAEVPQANAFPFGSVSGGNPYRGEYQQIYDRLGFQGLGPLTITQIAFASSSLGSPFTAAYNITINLSSTTTPMFGPDPNFEANKGADFTTVFSGDFTATLSASDQFDLVIDLATPFTYDPSRIGNNLLLDVVIHSSTLMGTTAGDEFTFIAGRSAFTGRVYHPGGDPRNPSEAASGYGLRTRFTAQPIPEPATLVLLGTGLAGVAARVRRGEKLAAAEERSRRS